MAGSDGNPPTPTAYLQGSQRALQVYSSGLEPSAPGLATPHIDKMGHQVPKRHGKGRRRRFHGRVPVLLTDAIRLLMYNAFCLTHLLLTIPHLPCYATYRLEEHPPSRPLTNRSTLPAAVARGRLSGSARANGRRRCPSDEPRVAPGLKVLRLSRNAPIRPGARLVISAFCGR